MTNPFARYGGLLKKLKWAKIAGPARRAAAITGESFASSFLRMAGSTIRHGIAPTEYLHLRFYELDGKRRSSYLSTVGHIKFLNEINDVSKLDLLRDKGVGFKRIGALYGRAFLDLREAGFGEFQAFALAHPKFLAKEFDSYSGRGIAVYEDLSGEAALRAAFEESMRLRRFVIEEFIDQHPAISRVYPHSVNSLRLHTISRMGEARVFLYPLLRFGSGGRKIDTEEGYTVLVDPESGKTFTKGLHLTKKPEIAFSYGYERHPDTGEELSGLTVPFLAEALSLAREAALAFPELAYIGWDIGLTAKGPVIIEGNGASGASLTYQRLWGEISGGYGSKGDYMKMLDYARGGRGE